MIYLKLANLEDAKAEYEALQKIPMSENGFRNEYTNMTEDEFKEKALAKIIANSKGEDLPEGYIPFSIYFLWDDDKIVGLFHFRHYLCDSLKEHGGHIGYTTIKEYRNQGYASEGLRLLLDEVRDKIPEDEFLLDARKDNLASQKVMLDNGAYKVDDYTLDGIEYVRMKIKK